MSHLPELGTCQKGFVVNAKGRSMWPLINPGARIVVAPAYGDPPIGTIVVFYDEKKDGYIAHRLVSNQSGKYLTKGDSKSITEEVKRGSMWGFVEGVELANRFVQRGDPMWSPLNSLSASYSRSRVARLLWAVMTSAMARWRW